MAVKRQKQFQTDMAGHILTVQLLCAHSAESVTVIADETVTSICSALLKCYYSKTYLLIYQWLKTRSQAASWVASCSKLQQQPSVTMTVCTALLGSQIDNITVDLLELS